MKNKETSGLLSSNYFEEIQPGIYQFTKSKSIYISQLILNVLLFTTSIYAIYNNFAWLFFWKILTFISFFNCIVITVRKNTSSFLVTNEKLFFAPTLWSKGPWLYWHEIDQIVVYPHTILIIPHDTTPVIKRLSLLHRFFYETFWQLNKRQPSFKLLCRIPRKILNTVGAILIEQKKQATRYTLTHPQLVIFDCDGTLVDSELLSYEIYANIFAKEGFHKKPEDLLKQLSGFTIAAMIEAVENQLGRKLPHELEQKIQEEIANAFIQKLHPIKGIPDLLRKLQEENIPFCLVSNGLLDRITAALTSSKLTSFFPPSIVFDVGKVKRGKPAPDLLLYVAEKYNLSPHSCLVIEDSATGIKAAHAAGMPTVALLAGEHAQTDWYKQQTLAQHPTLTFDFVNDLEHFLF